MSAADGGAAALLIAGLGTGGTDVMYEDDLTDNSIPDIQVHYILLFDEVQIVKLRYAFQWREIRDN